jgi:excisionase family DNA binding protein
VTRGLMTTMEASAQLGVSARRVRALVEQGDLDAERTGRTLLVQPESVARYQAKGRARTRSLSPRMSWAALISEIGITDVERVSNGLRLSSSERGRLRDLHHRPAADWTWLARRRANPRRYSVRTAYLADLLGTRRVVASGISAIDHYDVHLTSRAGSAEVYAEASTLETLVDDFAIRPDANGNLIVHVLPQIGLVKDLVDLRVMPCAVVAVDLLEAGESRARRAGLELLERLRDQHRS